MDDAPQPPCRGADEALLEVAADKLKKKIAALDQIASEMPAGNRHRRPVLAAENETRAADVGAAVEHIIMRQDDSRRRSVAPGAGHRDTMAESVQSIDRGLGNAIFNHQT